MREGRSRVISKDCFFDYIEARNMTIKGNLSVVVARLGRFSLSFEKEMTLSDQQSLFETLGRGFEVMTVRGEIRG